MKKPMLPEDWTPSACAAFMVAMTAYYPPGSGVVSIPSPQPQVSPDAHVEKLTKDYVRDMRWCLRNWFGFTYVTASKAVAMILDSPTRWFPPVHPIRAMVYMLVNGDIRFNWRAETGIEAFGPRSNTPVTVILNAGHKPELRAWFVRNGFVSSTNGRWWTHPKLGTSDVGSIELRPSAPNLDGLKKKIHATVQDFDAYVERVNTDQIDYSSW